jgi:DNA replication and repair protein RecF
LLQLTSISLTQFTNYRQQQFDFKERIIGICGLNGMGKTNLLNAIYYCCFTKSYFTKSDSQHVLSGAAGFRIEGHFNLNRQPLKVVCILRETGRKEFSVEDEPYSRFADHIGKLPCVMIAPDDIQIITGGPEERRRFMDAILSQLNALYLRQLIDYNKVLQQRNGFLKSEAGTTQPDTSLLQVYDEQLARYGTYIHEERKKFLTELIPLVNRFYRQIAGSDEQVTLVYESQLLHAGFKELLAGCRQKDFLLQRTNAGIHKDDIDIALNGQPFKAIASQGQRKSLLFALKLAEFELLAAAKGFAPLLLLDDVFEKLDEQRMHNLLEQVCVHNDGQLFITDTHEERIRRHFDKLQHAYQLFRL